MRPLTPASLLTWPKLTTPLGHGQQTHSTTRHQQASPPISLLPGTKRYKPFKRLLESKFWKMERRCWMLPRMKETPSIISTRSDWTLVRLLQIWTNWRNLHYQTMHTTLAIKMWMRMTLRCMASYRLKKATQQSTMQSCSCRVWKSPIPFTGVMAFSTLRRCTTLMRLGSKRGEEKSIPNASRLLSLKRSQLMKAWSSANHGMAQVNSPF